MTDRQLDGQMDIGGCRVASATENSVIQKIRRGEGCFKKLGVAGCGGLGL